MRRVIVFGGVYGELPYDKERSVSSIYSMPDTRVELDDYAVNFSNYQGGSSIGTYLCERAIRHDVDFVGFYAFVPTYDFSRLAPAGQSIRIENDFMAWYGVMRRVNHMLDLKLDLSDLARRTERLLDVMEEKVVELEKTKPQLGVREYMERLSAEFDESPYYPLDSVWEEELRNLFDSEE